jgi:hypothetical protein
MNGRLSAGEHSGPAVRGKRHARSAREAIPHPPMACPVVRWTIRGGAPWATKPSWCIATPAAGRPHA